MIYLWKVTVVGYWDSRPSFCLKVTRWYPVVRWLLKKTQREREFIPRGTSISWAYTYSQILRGFCQCKGENSPCNCKLHQHTRYGLVWYCWRLPHAAQSQAKYAAIRRISDITWNNRLLRVLCAWNLKQGGQEKYSTQGDQDKYVTQGGQEEYKKQGFLNRN